MIATRARGVSSCRTNMQGTIAPALGESLSGAKTEAQADFGPQRLIEADRQQHRVGLVGPSALGR